MTRMITPPAVHEHGARRHDPVPTAGPGGPAGHGTPDHAAHEHDGGHGGHGDHVAMFRRRFWWSLLLTVPVVATSHMVMDWFGYSLDFPGMGGVGPVFGSVVFAWAGWPFLSGGCSEVRSRQPG